MNINLTISQAPGITTNYLVSAIYETNIDGSVGPLVTYQAFAAPHSAPRNVSFTGLGAIVYKHILWENTTATPGGTQRGDFIYDPAYGASGITLRADLVLVVGAGTGNPVAGETSFTRADLADWEYSVEKRGVGTMRDPEEILINTAGGWDLTQPGDLFYEGDVWVLHFEPQVSDTPVEPQISGKVFSTSDIVKANTTLTASDLGKAKVIQSSSDNITITLPALSAVGSNRMIALISEGGNHKNATILCSGTDKINFLGTVDRVILGQSERIYIYRGVDDGGDPVWQISMDKGQFAEVGQIVHSFGKTQKNCVFADGTLLDRAVYPRLWAWVQTLPADMLVTDANWNNPALKNKARFSTGDGTTTFRVPCLYEYGFLRGVDGTVRVSGSFQDHAMLTHQHEGTIGTLVTTLFGRGISRLMGIYGGLATGLTDLVSTPKKSDGTGITNIDTETRPMNSGIYLLIKI